MAPEETLPTPPWLEVCGNIILLIFVLSWARTVFAPHDAASPPWIFLDFANLIFHEAGHVIFMFFGDFMHILGGSLTQVLIPALIFGIFVYQQSWYAAGFSMFWLGESLTNVSYYIADARAEALPLLGGDSSGHDWHWLLNDLNQLPNDTLYGHIVFNVGAALILAGICWMIYAAYQTIQRALAHRPTT